MGLISSDTIYYYVYCILAHRHRYVGEGETFKVIYSNLINIMNPRGLSFGSVGFEFRFPTGRDSATFRDKGTEVPSLSRNKGTTGQAQNLATRREGRDSLSKSGTGRETGQSLFFCQNPGQDAEQDGKVILSLDVPGQRSLSRDFCSCPCRRTKGQRDKEIFFFPG